MQLLTCMVFIVITVTYVVLGGIAFHFLESTNEEESMSSANGFLVEFLENNTCVSREELVALLAQTARAYSAGQLVQNGTSTASNWDYYSSIFFSMTVVTTIGYGNISPVTVPGRIFCVLFALFGIPLFLVCATAIGARLLFVVKKGQKCCFRPDMDGEMSKKARTCGGIFYIIFGIGLFMVVPGIIFTVVEGWTIPEGLYYAFITTTTIGFGDYVAGASEADTYSHFRGIYRLCVAAWIFLGLSWMAGVLTSMQELYSKPSQRDSDAKSQASRHSRTDPRMNAVMSPEGARDFQRVYSVERGDSLNGSLFPGYEKLDVETNGNVLQTKL